MKKAHYPSDARVWEMVLVDGKIPEITHPTSCQAADIDGDGHVEIVIGGFGGLVWYRYSTGERGVIDRGMFSCGLALEDIDGDGRYEIVADHTLDPSSPYGTMTIVWYKPHPSGLDGPWEKYTLDPRATGAPHDMIFADLDGSGRRCLVTPHVYVDNPGLFIYRPAEEVTAPWKRFCVQQGFFGDGTLVVDLDNDGLAEIVAGPNLWHAPPGGVWAGPWERTVLAPDFREMCRAVAADITGTGRPDVVICEAEYLDGRISWFENRTAESRERPWIEHPLPDDRLYYAHSLQSFKQDGTSFFVVGEMAEGGWNPPRNWDARLIQYSTRNGGAWDRRVIHHGCGTHEAILVDVDNDGELEIVGKQHLLGKVQVWKAHAEPALKCTFTHSMIDRDKPSAGIDAFAVDLIGTGRRDVCCGRWWYRNPDWHRFVLPGRLEALNSADIDGDGREELICCERDDKNLMTSRFYWIKPRSPETGEWDIHCIGRGRGDWAHATCVAPLLPGGRLALVTAYHSAHAGGGDPPQIWEIPDDPAGPWSCRTLVDLAYGEEIVAHDMTGNGLVDLVLGSRWLENRGDGTFAAHRIGVLETGIARVKVADLSGNGLPDIVFVVEDVDWDTTRTARFAPIGWYENPGDPRSEDWKMHIIDQMRSPHSLDVADIDGDGRPELIVGEHDPFHPYRSRCRTAVYRMAGPGGRLWTRHIIDDRFEHHDGTRVTDLGNGRMAVLSHGWQDVRYLHLWDIRRME